MQVLSRHALRFQAGREVSKRVSMHAGRHLSNREAGRQAVVKQACIEVSSRQAGK